MTKMTIKIPGYLQRMLEEDKQLETRLKALDAYIKQEIKISEVLDEKPCMCQEIDQLTAMISYAEALNERIDTAFTDITRTKLYKNRYDKNGKIK